MKITQKEFIFQQAPFKECHASTLARLGDGTFLAAWFGGTKEGHNDVSIWLARRSPNGGWSAPVMVARVREAPHWNPVLFVPADGVARLFFKVGDWIDKWETWLTESRDNGVTWSAPRELVPGDKGGRGPVKNKPIVLADGAWLAPASLEPNNVWSVFVDRSEDGGKTWTACQPPAIDRSVVAGVGVIQPTLWESAPGCVHMLMRSSCGRICASDSRDGGRTWSPVRLTTLFNNNSGIDAVRNAQGTLLLVYNPVADPKVRTPLSLAVSRDNGAAWERCVDLETDEGEFSYPSVIATPDGFAGVHTWKRKTIVFWQTTHL